METSNTKKLSEFYKKMIDSTDYIGMADLKDQYSYKIVARNAYVGVWVKKEKAFLVSRYKAGPQPYLFFEYHWDTGEPFGTVKPLELIEKCPFEISKPYHGEQQDEVLKYLDELEEKNPVVCGVNSLLKRKQSAINFQNRLNRPLKSLSTELAKPRMQESLNDDTDASANIFRRDEI